MCLLSSFLLVDVTYFDILKLHLLLHFFYLNNSLDKIKLQIIFFIYRQKKAKNFQKENRNRFSLLPQMNERALLYSYLRTVVSMALFHHFSNDPAHALHNMLQFHMGVASLLLHGSPQQSGQLGVKGFSSCSC